MKKLLLLFSVSVCVFAYELKAQSTFFNLYGSTVGEEGTHVSNVSGGGYVVAGTTDAGGFGYRDIEIWRIDSTGAIIWSRTIGTTYWDFVCDVVPISGGGFYVATEFIDPSSWQNDSILVTKLDAAGSVLWTRFVNTSSYTYNLVSLDIEATSGGGFIVLMQEDSVSSNRLRLKMVSCDASGTVLWAKKFMTNSTYYRSNFLQCANGDIVAAITTQDTLYNHYMTLIRVSSSGLMVWCSESPLTTYEVVVRIVTDGNEFYISTTSNGITHHLHKYGSTGSCLWSRTVVLPSFIHYGWIYGMAIKGGKICMVGTARNLGNYMEGHIMEFDTAGNFLNSGFLFSGVNTELYDVEYNPAGDVVLTGSVRTGFISSDTMSMFLTVGDLSSGNICGYISIPFSVSSIAPLVASNISLASVNNGSTSNAAMLTSTGSLIQVGCIVGVSEATQSSPQVYPNPATDILTIEIPFGVTTFQLYNNLGQCVRNMNLIGTRAEISVAELPEGVYYYTVADENGKVYSDKLVIQ